MSQKIDSGFLNASDRHQIYWETHGNPAGIPVMIMHGGPGFGMDDHIIDYFDLGKFLVIAHDQRGTRRSLPLGELSGNNTSALVQDVDSLRKYLKLDKIWLFGGSWGSSLSLEYAKTHPDKCLGLIIFSIFLGRPQDDEWTFFKARRFFPQEWKDFTEGMKVRSGFEVIKNYRHILENTSPSMQMAYIKKFLVYGERLIHLMPPPKPSDKVSPEHAEAVRIFFHYASNNYFLGRRGALSGLKPLRNKDIFIVHGRYDMDAPISQAFELQRLLPDADFRITETSGHASTEDGIKSNLLKVLGEIQDCAR